MGVRRGAGLLGLELRFWWGDHRVGEYFWEAGKTRSFTVGWSEGGVDFVVGGRNAPSKVRVVSSDEDGFALHLGREITGELLRQGETTRLAEARESEGARDAGGSGAIALERGDFACLRLGEVRLELAVRPAPHRVRIPLSHAIDFAFLNLFLVLFFLFGVFILSAMNGEPDEDDFADEAGGSRARVAKLLLLSPEAPRNPLLRALAEQKAGVTSAAATPRPDERQPESREPKRRDPRRQDGAPSSRGQARTLAASIFGGGRQGLASALGSGLGDGLHRAMGQMLRAEAGDTLGLGRGGLRGSTAGSGGTGETQGLGIGAIGTQGRWGGTEDRTGSAFLGTKKAIIPAITASAVEIVGSLDRELIREVIHRNQAQIRYCYERQLLRFPELSGRLAVRFIISGSGLVASSSVTQSTIDNTELEACVSGRVRTWLFPKPKGGGVVIVTYPFVFKQTGD